jgi:hypothetical protein
MPGPQTAGRAPPTWPIRVLAAARILANPRRRGHPKYLCFGFSTDSLVRGDPRLATTMLDGKSYYTVFPDESSEMKVRLQRLFEKMAKLEEMLRRHVEELRAEPATTTADFPADSPFPS